MSIKLILAGIFLVNAVIIFWIISIAARIIAAINGISGIPSLTEDTDRRQWNAQWESYLKRAHIPMVIHRIAYRWGSMGHSGVMESQLSHIRINLRGTCSLQRCLTERTLDAIVRDHFESRWQEMEESVREEHLLEGLVRTCTRPKGEGYMRLNCPELTLVKLQEGEGQGFLHLLKFYILDDYSVVPKKPLLLPNRSFDHPRGDRTRITEFYIFREGLIIDRNMFICRFLLNTLDSFYGNAAAEVRTMRNSAHPRGLSDQQKTVLGRALGRPAVRATQTAMRNFRKDVEAHSVTFCETCQKSDQEISKKFLECVACRTQVRRRVLYCSKQCQKQDWKPRHRDICGKLLTLETARSTAVSALIHDEDPTIYDISHPNMQIGPPCDGFIRPPALKYLVHHINALHTSQPDLHAEYILLARSGQLIGINIHNPDLRRAFRSYSVKAMTTGDRTAVTVMGQFLISEAHESGATVTRSDIVAQLKREYEVDLDSEIRPVEESDMKLEKYREGATVVESDENACVL